MTRREIREQVFILLFQREFYGREPFDEQKETYMETKEWTEKDQAYIEEHMAKIMDKLPEIDELISEHSNGWKLDRIGKEELAILRLQFMKQNLMRRFRSESLSMRLSSWQKRTAKTAVLLL